MSPHPMAGESFEVLEWDSRFFGFTTARILHPRLDRPDLEAILGRLAARDVRLAYWASDPSDLESQHAADACGGFPADLKLTYDLDAGPLRVMTGEGLANPAVSGKSSRKSWRIRPSRAALTEGELLPLALLSGEHSRFRADPRFPPALFRALFEEWGRKSLDGTLADEILAAKDGGDVAGMVTVTAREGLGRIGLLAVSPRHQGLGLGSDLLRAAGGWFAARGCLRAQVVTQGANAAACELYKKGGYRIGRREILRHFWPLGSVSVT